MYPLKLFKSGTLSKHIMIAYVQRTTTCAP